MISPIPGILLTFCLFLTITGTGGSIPLSDIQPVTGFSSLCTSVHNTPLPSCSFDQFFLPTSDALHNGAADITTSDVSLHTASPPPVACESTYSSACPTDFPDPDAKTWTARQSSTAAASVSVTAATPLTTLTEASTPQMMCGGDNNRSPYPCGHRPPPLGPADYSTWLAARNSSALVSAASSSSFIISYNNTVALLPGNTVTSVEAAATSVAAGQTSYLTHLKTVSLPATTAISTASPTLMIPELTSSGAADGRVLLEGEMCAAVAFAFVIVNFAS